MRSWSALLWAHRKDSRILVSFLLFAIVSLGLAALISEVAEGDIFAIDKIILRGLREAADPAIPLGPTWLRQVMVDLTALGSTAVLSLISILAVGYLLTVQRVATAIFAGGSIAFGALISSIIKTILVRPRPDLVPHFVQVTSPSFPSGHSMNSAVVYLTLAVLIARGERNLRVQVYLIGAAVCLALLVGFSRVYLGVHWPSDVMAGWTIGAGWASVCSLTAKYLQRRRKIEAPGRTST